MDIKIDIITNFWIENQTSLFSFILERVPDKLAAEDILQDVYLKLHLAVDTINNLQKLRAWVYQVARNTISDYFRDRYRSKNESIIPDIESITVRKDESYKLNFIINTLPDKYRIPLVLADLKNMPHRAVAEITGLSLSTTKSRILRARVLLAKAMRQHCIFKVDKYGNIVDCIDRNCKTRIDPEFE